MSHNDIIKCCEKLLRKSGKRWTTPAVFTEIVTSNNEIPDVIGFASGYSSLVEVKTSRKDFLRDKKKSFRANPEQGMGNYRFYACPSDLIKVDELPENWGLIYVTPNGKCEMIKFPEWQQSNVHAEHRFMYSVIRRLINK